MTTEQCNSPMVMSSLDEGLLHLRWADEGWEASTDVELRLEDVQGGTRVLIRESGWERLSSGELLASEHRLGWRMHLTHLRPRSDPAAGAVTGAEIAAVVDKAEG